MKKILPFAFVVLFYSSCYVNLPYAKTQVGPIPTFKHERQVDLYYPEEEKPNISYVKLGVLEANLNGNVSYDKLSKILIKQAQARGADALFLYQKQLNSDTYDTQDGGIATTQISSLSALAIKYVDSINYLDRLVREATIFDSAGQKASIQYDFFGEPDRYTGDFSLYKSHVMPYDLKELLLARDDWVYTRSGSFLVRRKMDPYGFPYIKVKIPAGKQPAYIKVNRDQWEGPQKITLSLSYDKHGRVVEKIIDRGMQMNQLKQTFTYENGLLHKQEVFEITDTQETPVLSISYSYYSNEDLPQLLSNAKASMKK